MSDIKDRYESFNYAAIPFVQTHPVHLATMSQLHGLEPVDPRRCRYLEVGCANGLNIIGMAGSFPESQFVGIDLAESYIAEGLAQIERLGLTNVELIAGDLMDFPLDGEPFDYLVAHGFYCWVPEFVQNQLWLLCEKLLSPHGIAYISYNTYPGCYQRRMLREMMLFHTRQIEEPAEKVYQARAFLQFFDEAQALHGELVAGLRHEVDQLMHLRQDYAVYHDDLAPINVPLYFHQFVAEASRHGLQFLSEADFFEMCFLHFPENVQTHLQSIAATDVLLKEQYLDFLKLRRFRETLLCRSEHRLSRHVGTESIKQHRITSRAKVIDAFRLPETEETTFAHEKGAKLTLNHPISKLAMRLLGSSYPAHWSFESLLKKACEQLQQAGQEARCPEDEEQLARTIFTAFSVGLVDLHCLSPGIALVPPERPRITPLVEDQLKHGQHLVTNLMHYPVNIETDFVASFLLLCDGTRTRDELIDACASLGGDSEIAMENRVDHAIRQALQLALFVE